MEVSTDWKDEPTMQINPSWILQSLVLIMLAISGYLIDGRLTNIDDEMQLSRIERAQLRSDMSALEIGLRGDRFTNSDWRREQEKIAEQLDQLRERIRDLEKNH